jgi:hypothetical protein
LLHCNLQSLVTRHPEHRPMTNPPDTVRNALAHAHGLARTARFDPTPARPPALEPCDPYELAIARLKARNAELKLGIDYLLAQARGRP